MYPRQKASRAFVVSLYVLLVMIVTLMALGAGVRTMNAGLSCPDWPLCFGQVIPDFHPIVWFEFVHRAYAGLVALVFLGVAIYVFRSRSLPGKAKWAASLGAVVLIMQILMGALTVLKNIGPLYVTSHLMLATVFFCSVLWILFLAKPIAEEQAAAAPDLLKVVTGFLVLAVFVQIFLGGYVASTYAGSVCVDWPLCNGKFIPTWEGIIGLQIMHRMMAYALVAGISAYAFGMYALRDRPWMTGGLLSMAGWSAGVVWLQLVIGVANLLLYIPAWMTVAHQTTAIVLLAINLRTFAMALALAKPAELASEIYEPPQKLAGVSG